MPFEAFPTEPENNPASEESNKQGGGSLENMSDAYLREIQGRIAERKEQQAKGAMEDVLDRAKRGQEGITSQEDLDLRESAKEMADAMEHEELNEYLGPDLALEKLSPDKIDLLVKNEAERADFSESQINTLVDRYQKMVRGNYDTLDEKSIAERQKEKDISPARERIFDVAGGRIAIKRLLEIQRNDDISTIDAKTLQPLALKQEERDKRLRTQELISKRIGKISKFLGRENVDDLFGV